MTAESASGCRSDHHRVSPSLVLSRKQQSRPYLAYGRQLHQRHRSIAKRQLLAVGDVKSRFGCACRPGDLAIISQPARPSGPSDRDLLCRYDARRYGVMAVPRDDVLDLALDRGPPSSAPAHHLRRVVRAVQRVEENDCPRSSEWHQAPTSLKPGSTDCEHLDLGSRATSGIGGNPLPASPARLAEGPAACRTLSLR